ncbi:MAG: SpoIIIAH-like family protein [Firmicutes bacterium]|nr:SpoIIIAH-like family protein [Bacillota bacterium]
MGLASLVDFFSKYRKPVLWIFSLAIMVGATWWVIQGLETKIKSIDILTDEELALDPAAEAAVDGEDKESGNTFFAGYRLQRDRVRDQSLEMLETLLENPNAGAEAKAEAEQLLLEIVRMREQELLVESMIKAQGYEDAVFFYHEEIATVMVKEKDLDEKSFIQITETVSGALGVARENVQVMARP